MSQTDQVLEEYENRIREAQLNANSAKLSQSQQDNYDARRRAWDNC